MKNQQISSFGAPCDSSLGTVNSGVAALLECTSSLSFLSKKKTSFLSFSSSWSTWTRTGLFDPQTSLRPLLVARTRQKYCLVCKVMPWMPASQYSTYLHSTCRHSSPPIPTPSYRHHAHAKAFGSPIHYPGSLFTHIICRVQDACSRNRSGNWKMDL